MTDFQKAIADPEAVFKTPSNVIKDTSFSKEQKLKILEQWKHDAKLLETAEEENMKVYDEKPSMLSRISRAIDELNNQ